MTMPALLLTCDQAAVALRIAPTSKTQKVDPALRAVAKDFRSRPTWAALQLARWLALLDNPDAGPRLSWEWAYFKTARLLVAYPAETWGTLARMMVDLDPMSPEELDLRERMLNGRANRAEVHPGSGSGT